MPRNNIDDDVKGKFDGLIANMRAKRLASQLPSIPADPAVNDEHDTGGGDDDQAALEAMLNDGNDGEPDDDTDDQQRA